MFLPVTILAALGLVGLAQAKPLPESELEIVHISPMIKRTESGEIESHLNATAMDIDIYGPMPTDSIQEDGHHWAEIGSRAYAWARAQIDIDWDDIPIEKRRVDRTFAHDIGISYWTEDSCRGQKVYFDRTQQYGLTFQLAIPDYDKWHAVGISRRRIREQEHLDLFMNVDGKACAMALNRIYGGPGCATVKPFTCIRLWKEEE